MKERLAFREWIICVTSVLSVAFLFVISFSPDRRNVQENVKNIDHLKKITVVVSGAVVNPGRYEVEVGTSLKKVLDKVGFRVSADKKSLYSKKTLLNSCEVFVPEKNVKKRQEKSSCLGVNVKK